MDKGLLLVGSIYYFQKRIPDKLANLIGIKMFKRSLETDSYSAAKKFVAKLHEVYEGIFKEYKRIDNAYQDYTKEDMLKLLSVEFYKVVDTDNKRVLAVLEDKYLHQSKSSKKVKTLVKLYLDYLDKVKKLKNNTLLSVNSALLVLNKVAGEKTVTELLNEDITATLDEYKQKNSDSSIKLYLTKIKSFLKWVEETEDVTISRTLIKFISDSNAGIKAKSLRDAFTIEQLQTIFGKEFNVKFPEPAFYFQVLLAYTCGLRIGEANAITVDDITKYKNRYVIRIKEGKTESAKRYVVVPKILHRYGFELYFEQIKDNNPESSVWINNVLSVSISRRFTQYLIELGIKQDMKDRKYTEHSLRHSFATKLIASAVDERYAKKYFGHSGSALMESRYMIQNPEIEDIIEQVDSKLDFTYELQDLTPFNDTQMKLNRIEQLKQLVEIVDYKGINVDDYVLSYYRSLNEEQLLNVDTSELDEMNMIAFISVIVEKKILNK